MLTMSYYRFLNKEYHYELLVIAVIKNEIYTFNIFVNL